MFPELILNRKFDFFWINLVRTFQSVQGIDNLIPQVKHSSCLITWCYIWFYKNEFRSGVFVPTMKNQYYAY